MNSREGINEERVPTSIPSQKMTIQTTSLSENNNKENNNIDSSFIVVAGKMSASGSAATSATAAIAATATNSSPKSSRKTKRWFSFVLENIERDARFRTMCTETLNKSLQKAYEKLTKRETQAHNKEWILLKMARFVLETNNAAGEEEREEEEEEEYKEEEEEREAVKNSMFARLRQILEETVESEREEEGHTRNVPAPSSSNNSNYNNNFRKNRKRKVTTKEREEKTAAVAAVSSTTMIPLQCSRNDGKSWRCSALAVEGHKHCAKHLRWGYGARAANNAQHIASIANIIAAAEKNNKNNNNNKHNNNSSKLMHRNKDTRALEKKSRHLPKRRVNLSDAGEKQQRLREEKMYEQHRVEYDRRMQKKIKSSVVQTTSSDGTNIACTIEVCEKNEEREDDCLSENTSIPLFSRPGGSLKNSSSSSLSSLSSSSIGVMKTINLDDFSGYGPLREHLLKLAAGASSNSTGREISVVYWTAHNTAHQIALGEPYEYFKAKCVKLHAKVYPKASSSGTGGGFRSIKIPLVAGPTSSSSSSSSPSATMYMMLMMQNDKNKNIFFPASST